MRCNHVLKSNRNKSRKNDRPFFVDHFSWEPYFFKNYFFQNIPWSGQYPQGFERSSYGPLQLVSIHIINAWCPRISTKIRRFRENFATPVQAHCQNTSVSVCVCVRVRVCECKCECAGVTMSVQVAWWRLTLLTNYKRCWPSRRDRLTLCPPVNLLPTPNLLRKNKNGPDQW